MRTTLYAILFACGVATQAFAEVTSISFEQLVQSSDIVVVAKVESVTHPIIGRRYAKAKVTEVWKGTETERVQFLASPTWTCDISKAKKGETVLLFLRKVGKSRSYAISHSGRGRMPLRTVDSKSYATFWPDVLLPKDTPIIDGPEPQWDFIRSVEVETLRYLAKRALESEVIEAALTLMQRHGCRSDWPLRSIKHDDAAKEWVLLFDGGFVDAGFRIYLRDKSATWFEMQYSAQSGRTRFPAEKKEQR